LEFLKAAGRISFDLPPLRGHAYFLNGTSNRPIAGDGYLLVGDSAGLASLQSGEGILPAVESGLLAARNILGRNNLDGRQRFDSYQILLACPRQSGLMRIGRSLPSPMVGFLGRRLLKTRWFVRDVVLDDWFLHQHHSAVETVRAR